MTHYQAELERFLERATRSGSVHTRRVYGTELDRLEAWCRQQVIAPR